MNAKTPLFAATFLTAVVSAHASTSAISLNFTGRDDYQVAGSAGGPVVTNGQATFFPSWNNLAGASGTQAGLTVYDYIGNAAVSVPAATANWSSPVIWSLGDTSVGANLAGGDNPLMMRGYLDSTNGNGSTPTVTVSGLDDAFGANSRYAVLVYFDGSNGGSWRVGNYTIDGITMSGEDSEGVDFNTGGGGSGNENPDGLFQQPIAGGAGNQLFGTQAGGNNNEGNYVYFPFLAGDSFTITSFGGPQSDITRAPINGVQIIAIPEPSRVLLLAGGLAFAALWRKRGSML